MTAPESFRPGDCVRKFTTSNRVTPYVGTVTHVIPKTYKVWVQWPMGNSQEDPETLIIVTPFVGMPVALQDGGYDSCEKQRSERMFGKALRPMTADDKMVLRVAHDFATDVVGRLLQDVGEYQGKGLNDIQAYNRIYEKYGSHCSDHILRMAVAKVYDNKEMEF